MKLHLIALPHTRVTAEFCGCAYTAKTLKFTKMMRHHDVTLYAPEGSTRDYCELVEVLSDAERIATFGEDDPARLPEWPTEAQTFRFNIRAAEALMERYAPGDVVLLTGGATHAPIMPLLPNALFIEPGVGYEGIATDKCAFESAAWRHHVYAKRGIHDGRWFDRVIPNYFDADEFPLTNEGGGEYLLYLGRLVSRKGPQIAAELADAAGLPLIVAGAGGKWTREGIVADELTLTGDRIEHVGPVGVEERARLMAGARAVLVPTTYIEPFGGVAVEAMMCGTPAITTDWGAFTETVPPPYRFRTFQQGLDAIELAADVDHAELREYAHERFALDAVAPMFDEWLDALDSLWADGWYRRRTEATA